MQKEDEWKKNVTSLSHNAARIGERHDAWIDFSGIFLRCRRRVS